MHRVFDGYNYIVFFLHIMLKFGFILMHYDIRGDLF